MKSRFQGVNLLILIIFLCCLLNGCQKDDGISCFNAVSNLGKIDLEQKSKTFLPYQDLDTIIFNNRNYEEIYFTKRSNPTIGLIETQWILPCEGGLNNYEYEIEYLGNSIVSEELNLKFNLNLYPNMSGDFELFVDRIYGELKLNNSDSSELDSLLEMQIIASFRGNKTELGSEFMEKENYQFYENYEILGSRFDSVYIFNQNPKLGLEEVVYNKKHGLISFKDIKRNQWVFNRKK